MVRQTGHTALYLGTFTNLTRAMIQVQARVSTPLLFLTMTYGFAVWGVVIGPGQRNRNS